MLDFKDLWIDGAWTTPSATDVIEVRSPHDGHVVGHAPDGSKVDIDHAVATARSAFDLGPWPRMTPAERQSVVTRAGELYAERANELVDLTISENGSPFWLTSLVQKDSEARFKDFVEVAAAFDWTTVMDGEYRTMVRREPVGVVAAIVPWNAPQNLALTKILPALLAGCTVILKPSPETPLDALLLGELFAQAGLPAGVLNIVPADRDVSEYLVGHPGVDKIAFTGSTAAGRRIASVAGEQLKRVSLELGGKSAVILLPDADLDQAVPGVQYFGMPNNGEACVAHTRILVSNSRYDETLDALAQMVAGIAVGDPHDPTSFVGPLVADRQRERVWGYMDLGVSEGARVVAGGKGAPNGDGLKSGHYVRPTLFADVDNRMRIAQEEIFGPVLSVIRYEDEADAIRIANDSEYGLNGGVWTSDVDHGLEIARQVRTGGFHINGAPRATGSPFGGFKASGIGRENGRVGLEQYVEYKSIGY